MNNSKRFQCTGYFKRVIRLYEQLEIGHKGVPPSPESWKCDVNSVNDRVLTFFIFCHHIKDWIINDDLVNPQVIEKVEPFIESNPCLRSCADIANGVKHLKLKHKRSLALLKGIRTHRSISALKLSEIKRIDPLLDPPLLIKDFVYFETDQGKIDAFDLAAECVGRWREFIQENVMKR